jgi:hypothetical protein
MAAISPRTPQEQKDRSAPLPRGCHARTSLTGSCKRRSVPARLLREDPSCGRIDSQKGTLMARRVDSYCSRYLKCVRSAAFLVVLSAVGCGGLDTQQEELTSDVSDGYDDSLMPDPPLENWPDPNEVIVCHH